MSYSPNVAKYDPRTQGYNVGEYSLGKARAAWAGQRNGVRQMRMMCVGDSITAGSTGITGDQQLNSWPGRLRAALDARLGVSTGLGYVPASNNGTTGSIAYGGGTWTGTTGFPLAMYAGFSAGRTVTITFTTYTANAVIRVWSLSYGASAYGTVTIDGGAVANTAFNASIDVVQTTSYTVASAGAHTMVITNNGANNFQFAGYEVIENITTGVRVSNMGAGAMTTAGPAAAKFLAGVDIYQPDLSVIFLGANDMRTAVALATSLANLQTLITKCLTYGSVALVVPTGDGTNGFTENATFTAYQRMIYGLADTNNCAAIDLHKRLKDFDGATGDAIGHLTNTGAYDFAGCIGNIVLSQVL